MNLKQIETQLETNNAAMVTAIAKHGTARRERDDIAARIASATADTETAQLTEWLTSQQAAALRVDLCQRAVDEIRAQHETLVRQRDDIEARIKQARARIQGVASDRSDFEAALTEAKQRTQIFGQRIAEADERMEGAQRDLAALIGDEVKHGE